MKSKKACSLLISARFRLGYSQQEVADLVDVAQSTYHNWESGKTAMPVAKVSAISKVLEIDLVKLITS